MSDINTDSYTCPRCTVGRCQLQTSTFVEVVDGHLLSIPNIPTYICDICHFAEFEESALEFIWSEFEEVFDDEFHPPSTHERSSPYSE